MRKIKTLLCSKNYLQTILQFALTTIVFTFILQLNLFKTSNKNQSFLKHVHLKDLIWELPRKCTESVPYTDYNTTFNICLRENDLYVSSWFADYKSYEEAMMNIFLEAAHLDSSTWVLDIGCNIGAFTLAAASLDHSVIAVDPMPGNHGLLYNSLRQKFSIPNVIQLINAVSDTYTTMQAEQKNKANFGDIVMREIEESETINVNNVVQSIKFEDILDLVPENAKIALKLDVQGYECKALGKFLSAKVKKRFIPYILVEMIDICANDNNLCPEYRTEFLQNLEVSGYIPYMPFRVDYEKLRDKEFECPLNGFFIHKSALQPASILNRKYKKDQWNAV